MTTEEAQAQALKLLAEAGIGRDRVDVSTMEDIVLLCVDEGEHHFEIELDPSHDPEWFYRNRRTKEIVGDDFDLQSLDWLVKRYLGRLTAGVAK